MDFLLWQAISHWVPQEYMAPMILVLTCLVGLEQWLGATKKVKANSTLQAIMGTLNYFLTKAREKYGQK